MTVYVSPEAFPRAPGIWITWLLSGPGTIIKWLCGYSQVTLNLWDSIPSTVQQVLLAVFSGIESFEI